MNLASQHFLHPYNVIATAGTHVGEGETFAWSQLVAQVDSEYHTVSTLEGSNVKWKLYLQDGTR